jgi:hypothetical protein
MVHGIDRLDLLCDVAETDGRQLVLCRGRHDAQVVPVVPVVPVVGENGFARALSAS